MHRPQLKHRIRRILPFGIIWLLWGWLFLFVEMAATDGFSQVATGAIGMSLPVFVFASITVFFFGLLVGAAEVFYINRLFMDRSLGTKLLLKVLLYSCIFLIIILIAYPIAASLELGLDIFNPQVWNKFGAFFTSLTFASTMLQLSASLIASLFYSEISSHIGHTVLLQFLRGKYHRPVEEKRMFLFIDMNDSTGIAERLGHHPYFNLLKNYFQDMSRAIQKYEGEVYQYVGDEIVISWKMSKSASAEPAIFCFFEMQKAINERSQFYFQHFNVVPQFKAGLHGGAVTTGEIGVLKKEIIFTGDTLNATARILGVAKNSDADLVVSEILVDPLRNHDEFILEDFGEMELRGKQKRLKVFAVRQKTTKDQIIAHHLTSLKK